MVVERVSNTAAACESAGKKRMLERREKYILKSLYNTVGREKAKESKGKIEGLSPDIIDLTENLAPPKAVGGV